MKLEDIRNRTRANINEYIPDTAWDEFANETDDLLDVHIDAAVRMIAQVAPNYTMDIASGSMTGNWIQRADGRWVIVATLPPDYLRLEKITHTALKRPVTTLLTVQDPSYGAQNCPVPGIGAGEYAPKAYRVDGTVEVHSFGSMQDGYPTIQYIQMPKLTKDQTTNAQVYATLHDELLDPIAHQAAALYLSLTAHENAKAAQDVATASIQGLVMGNGLQGAASE